jgi:predicted esterase YcpF (UPF0227 family)
MTHLRPIHDDAGYRQMVALMNALLDAVGEDEDHALSGIRQYQYTATPVRVA